MRTPPRRSPPTSVQVNTKAGQLQPRSCHVPVLYCERDPLVALYAPRLGYQLALRRRGVFMSALKQLESVATGNS
jgi:hypothetical protein